MRVAAGSLLLSLSSAWGSSGSISGQITGLDVPLQSSGGVWVRLYPQPSHHGVLQPLDKALVDRSGSHGASWIANVRARGLEQKSSYHFRLDCPPGNYSVLAFYDPSDSGKLPLHHQVPLAWHASEACLGGVGICTDVVKVVSDDSVRAVDMHLRAPRPFPTEAVDVNGHGALRSVRGTNVLHLRGNAAERGFAHGYILAEQIVDFFEFFLLEDRLQKDSRYTNDVIPHLQANETLVFSEEFRRTAEGVLKGMRATGRNLLVQRLGRDFQIEDLYAINAYAELDMMVQDPGSLPPPKMCTQFVLFGDATKGSDTRGGTLAGRNMDGETDFRRLTISHLVVFAVEPSRGKRFISVMWPGFVGSLSGFNEDGLYVMENFGCPPSDAAIEGRGLRPNVDLVASMLQHGRVNGTTSRAQLKQEIERFNSADGGPCAHAGNLFFALGRHEDGELPGGFLLECDRYGYEIRWPDNPDVRPTDPNTIFASNHYMQYAVESGDFQADARNFRCNGGEPSFYSLWRYAVGQNALEAWERVGQPIGISEMKRLLQTVTEGITEHSVIWRPERLEFELAVATLDAPAWDAPYQEWQQHSFEEMFHAKRALSAVYVLL